MPDERETRRSSRAGWVLLAAGVAGAAAFWANRRYFTIHAVGTGETPEYPDIVPQVFAYPTDTVRAAALHACRSLPGWEPAAADGDEIRATAGECTCRRRTVTIRVEPVCGDRMAKVTLHSECEGRLPDLGANARGIRAFQARLSELLPSGGDAHAG